MFQDGTNKFILVTILAAIVAGGAVFIFETYGNQLFDPLWVAGISAAVVYAWSFIFVQS